MVNLLKGKNHFFSESQLNHLKTVKIILALSILTVFDFMYTPIAYADGKTNVFSFDYYSQANGLPNNHIQCIFQDRK